MIDYADDISEFEQMNDIEGISKGEEEVKDIRKRAQAGLLSLWIGPI